MKIPTHLGIIPDGNRRWAKSQQLEKHQGYHYGLAPGLRSIQMAKKIGVKEITYYGFTMDNCKRPKVQVQAFKKACVEAAKLITKDGAELFVLGNEHSGCFPKELLPYRTRQTVNGGGIRVNLLVNYDWHWDLSHIQKDGHPFSDDISRIDLLIRWGGMRRLSGFLPMQSVYSDIYVCDHLWPDYRDQDISDALNWYQSQDDTLGG